MPMLQHTPQSPHYGLTDPEYGNRNVHQLGKH